MASQFSAILLSQLQVFIEYCLESHTSLAMRQQGPQQEAGSDGNSNTDSEDGHYATEGKGKGKGKGFLCNGTYCSGKGLVPRRRCQQPRQPLPSTVHSQHHCLICGR